MTAYWYALMLAAAVFVATSIDDFLLVVLLLSGTDARPKAVILAKLLNAFMVVSLAALFVAWAQEIDDKNGLLAGGPSIALGVYRLLRPLWRARAAKENLAVGTMHGMDSQTFAGYSLVFAAGSLDNVAGYAALFAGRPIPVAAVSMATIFGMSAVLCAVAYLVVTSSWRIFQWTWRFERLVPYLLIGLGVRAIVTVHL